MSQTPLPAPAPYTCPNCGGGVEEGVPFCPRCGAAMGGKVAATSSVYNGCLSVFLALGALFFGAIGGCFVLFAVPAMGAGGTDMLPWAGFGLFMLGLAALCVYRIIKVNRPK